MHLSCFQITLFSFLGSKWQHLFGPAGFHIFQLVLNYNFSTLRRVRLDLPCSVTQVSDNEVRPTGRIVKRDDPNRLLTPLPNQYYHQCVAYHHQHIIHNNRHTFYRFNVSSTPLQPTRPLPYPTTCHLFFTSDTTSAAIDPNKLLANAPQIPLANTQAASFFMELLILLSTYTYRSHTL